MSVEKVKIIHKADEASLYEIMDDILEQESLIAGNSLLILQNWDLMIKVFDFKKEILERIVDKIVFFSEISTKNRKDSLYAMQLIRDNEHISDVIKEKTKERYLKSAPSGSMIYY